MDGKFIVSSSPHIKSNEDTSYIMKQVIIALIPAALASIYFFRLSALKVMVFCIIGSVVSEYLFQKISKKENTIYDYSAVLTGILLAFNLPASIPWWMCIVGSAFAIIVVKMVFGGIGHNFMNPALGARIFLLASFPVAMTSWTKPGTNISNIANIDALTTATPLNFLKEGTQGLVELSNNNITLIDTIIGNIGGCIGETCAIFIIIGGIYLIHKKIISYIIPLFYILTVFSLTFILGGFNIEFALFQLFTGGIMLGSFFMLTDYTTSPMSRKGQIIYSVLAGIITVVIRMYGGYPEGVSYSIVLVNVITPLIDKFVKPRIFGEVSK